MRRNKDSPYNCICEGELYGLNLLAFIKVEVCLRYVVASVEFSYEVKKKGFDYVRKDCKR